MPLKAAIIPHLDEITPESRLTGAVNTIVKVRRSRERSDTLVSDDSKHDIKSEISKTDGECKLVGTNTDYLGVLASLRAAILAQSPSSTSTSTTTKTTATAFPHGQMAAAIIGGGATTRSAILALHRLGLAPIYLINRDPEEVESTMEWFSRTELMAEGLELRHLRSTEQADEAMAGGRSRLGIIVGAIPAILPRTPAERLVYTIATHLFTSPSTSTVPSQPTSTSISPTHLPAPLKPIFLDMAYYPRPTPLTQIARALGWFTVDGMEAMIEQGFAQQRMWRMGDASVDVGMRSGILSGETEREARRRMLVVQDVKPEVVEVDRADEE